MRVVWLVYYPRHFEFVSDTSDGEDFIQKSRFLAALEISENLAPLGPHSLVAALAQGREQGLAALAGRAPWNIAVCPRAGCTHHGGCGLSYP